VSVNIKDKLSGLQSHVDEREHGQNNSINAPEIKTHKKTKLRSTLTLIL